MLNYILWYQSIEQPDLKQFNGVVEPNNGTVYTVGMPQGGHANYIETPDGLYTPAVSLARPVLESAASNCKAVS